MKSKEEGPQVPREFKGKRPQVFLTKKP